MNRKILIVITFVLVFTLAGCFGNYREGYKRYSRDLGDYALYYEDLEGDIECPYEEDEMFTLYTTEGNTFKYKGIRTTSGCYVPLKVDVGSGFSTVNNLLDKERITVTTIESVLWTFEFVVDQTPDYKVGTINFVEYFQEVGSYDVYVIDYDDTICHDLDVIMLFEHEGTEYDVLGAPSGDGCISEYYIYHVEQTEEDTTADGDDATDDDSDDDDEEEGVLLTLNQALEQNLVTVAQILRAEFESDIIEIYTEDVIYAESASIYFTDLDETYNEISPYELNIEQRTRVLEILSANRYRYVGTDIDEETPTLTLVNSLGASNTYIMYQPLVEDEETVIAVLTIEDIYGVVFRYEIYQSGMTTVVEDQVVFAENVNQNYILDMLYSVE